MRDYLKALIIGFLLFVPLALVSNIGEINLEYKAVIINQIYNTILIVISVVTLTLSVGGSSAWIIGTYDFPLKRQIEVLLVLGMVFPSYVLAFFYSEIFWFGGNIATILTLSVASLPYVFMMVTMSLRSQSQQLVYSALMLGKNEKWIKMKVLFPLIKPALILSTLLVVGDTISEFGATYFFGAQTVMTGIYEIWFGLHESAQGIRLAAYTFITLGGIYYFVNIWKKSLIGVQPRLQNEDSNQSIIPEKLGKKGWLITASFIPLLAITFFFPMGVLVKWVVLSYSQTAWIGILQATFNSTMLATFISLIVVGFSSLVLYLFKRKMIFITSVTNTLYSTPAIVLSIVAIYISGVFGTWTLPFLFVYILILKYMAMGIDGIGVGIQKINKQYYHTSKTLGKDSLWYVWNVQIPISLQSYLIAAILIWIDVIRELVIGLTLRPQWLQLLSVEIFRFMDLEKLSMSGPWIMAMVLVTVVPIYWINIVIKRHKS